MSDEGSTRRGVLALALVRGCLVAAYGMLGVQGLLFLLPKRLQARTRLLFAGRIDDYPLGGVRTIHDLEGTPVLIRRTEEGFTAFDATCPHLGCKVHWEPDEDRFFCPCHKGMFHADGVGYAGPPGDAGQRLSELNMKVDDASGVVYLEVKDVKGRSA